MPTILIIIIVAELVLVCAALTAAIVVPIIIARRATEKVRSEVSQLISKMDKTLGSSIKLLEVRDYYETTSVELKKMLDEALKEGNRPRQEALRKMIQRLDALKARALDKAVKILDGNATSSSRSRRRNSRRPRRKPNQQPNTKNAQSNPNRTNRSNRPNSPNKPNNTPKPKQNDKPN